MRNAFRFLLRHWLFVLILAGGIGLRVLAIVAYRPAIIYVDSITIYLNHLPGTNLGGLDSRSPDPLGYDMWLLRPVLAAGHLFTVTLIQHLLGLAMGLGTYAVLLRRGAWRWLSALAAAPVLLDAYQIFIEHMIMSDTLFEALITAGFGILVWNKRPGAPAIIGAGACLGIATTVRLIGAPLIAIFVIYLLIVLPGTVYKMIGAALTALCFLIPVLAYSVYLLGSPASTTTPANLQGGTSASTTTNALYARVATFVDCSTLRVPADEKALCPVEPPGQRHSPDYYAHNPRSPIVTFQAPAGTTAAKLVTDFSYRAISQQPLRMTKAVLRDAVRLFTWNHDNLANPDAPTERWRFQVTYPVYPNAVFISTVASQAALYGDAPPTDDPLAGAFLREYQLSIGFTPGPLMALCVALGVAGVIWAGRRYGGPNRLAAAAYLAAAIVVLGGADFYEFTWRYQLPAVILLPPVGVLGLMTLFWRPPPTDFPERDDVVASGAFLTEYGAVDLPPVTVVIAAYNEANGIGAVLDGMPATVEGPGGEVLDVATIVVVDGGTDDTAAIVRRHGAYVCEKPANRGQGAALRLGYHLARTGGARYIVTTDADGQHDIGQLPALLAPLLAGRADFVTGSRRLGTDHLRDSVRRTGVRVFALIVSVLTRTHITDTSFGFRAMRAEITGAVTLRQPQYQSSELLIGVLSHGYRVVELPMTMRVRSAGKSKKGNNVLYGFRYARVVFSTWFRERSSRSGLNTNRSSTKYLATNVTAYDPK